jgi:hypothetical protein
LWIGYSGIQEMSVRLRAACAFAATVFSPCWANTFSQLNHWSWNIYRNAQAITPNDLVFDF